MTQTEFRIVPLEPRHIPQIAALEKLCFSDPWSKESLEAISPGLTRTLVAETADGDVAGYLYFTVVLDEANVDNIAVAPAFRRLGLGEALLSTAIRREGSILRYVYLEVRASNEPALRLYEKMGFQTVGRRRGYYENPREDALLMTLFLDEESSPNRRQNSK